MKLESIPAGSIICRYAATPQGFAVVTVSGRTLAKSFFDLRHSHEFIMSINGAGCWVVLLPKPAMIQASLF